MSTITAGPALSVSYLTLSDSIAINARFLGREAAFIEGGETVDWQTFDRRVNGVAQALLRAGLRKGDRIAFLSGTSIWAYEIFFGIMRMGGVITPFSTLLTAEVLATLIRDSGADLLFVGIGLEELAAGARAKLGGGEALKIVTQSDGSSVGESFADFVHGSPNDPPRISFTGTDRCNIIYSSGTTGTPKGIVHTHEARLLTAATLGLAFRFAAGCRTVLATPPYSNGTMIAFLPTVWLGGTCIVMPQFDPGDFLDIVRQHEPTHTFLVPTQFQAILDHPNSGTADFNSFTAMITAGAPMPEGLKEAVQARIGPRLFELWGLTEGVATIITPEEIEQKPQSVGRPMGGSEIRLIDDDDREVAQPGTGEIAGRSLALMQGYWNRPKANAEVIWRDDAGVAFIRTGDIGELDEDGYLYIRGRKKDMIISGGVNVYPVDIETVLLQHGDVRDATVIGVPHEKWGEAPVAFVILATERGLTAGSLKEWANERLGKYQRLVDVVIRSEEFPRNAMGKVLKNKLRKEVSL